MSVQIGFMTADARSLLHVGRTALNGLAHSSPLPDSQPNLESGRFCQVWPQAIPEGREALLTGSVRLEPSNGG